MDIKVIVATHKEYAMPNDAMYLPLHVGAQKKDTIGYKGDNTGENISEKNPFFCELTGLYWAWKNLECDYIGLAHYRRHFSVKINSKDKFGSILTKKQSEQIFESTDVILPKKRNYYIDTIYNHYSNTHDSSHLDKTRKIISDKYPDYLPAFDKVMNSHKAHMFNMFIMKKDLADKYCEWLFDILFELENHIDVSDMSSFDARLFGRVSERLLDVWLIHNNIAYKEVAHMHMEPINWAKKIGGFLAAKFLKKKYDKSC